MIETKFKQTEIGLIPEDWEVKTLGEVCQNALYGVGAEAIAYNGVDKYIRITDIDDISGAYKPNPLASPSFYFDQHVVKENDLLVARTGASVGKSYLYNTTDGNLIFAGFLMKLNVCNANSQYVFYTTKTGRYMSWVASESARTGQPGLNLEQLKCFQIPFPPLAEQVKIAKTFSDVDALIAKKRDIKQGTMQQLLTGKKRLPGFTDEWKEKEIGEVVKIMKGQSLQSKDFVNGTIPVVAGGQSYAGYHNTANHIETCITISASGAYAGYIWLHNYPIFASDCSVMEGNDNVDVYFLYNVLKLNQDVIYKAQTGGAQPHIHPKDIAPLKVLCPSLSEQQAIATILTDMDNEIQALEAKRDKYTAIKQGMMQELLTGKIRLV